MTELLTIREVAKMFKVDARTVRNWIAKGKVRYVRTPGGIYRIPRAEAEKLLSETTRNVHKS